MVNMKCDCEKEVKVAVAQYQRESKNRRLANEDLYHFTYNKYFESIPIKEISDILNKYGFDSEPLEGIYTGREGRTHEKVGDYTYIVITWYKMQSGRYEIVVYLS